MDNNLDHKFQHAFICGLFQPEIYHEVRENYDLITDFIMNTEKDSRSQLNLGLVNYINSHKDAKVDVDDLYRYMVTDLKLINNEALSLINYITAANNCNDKSKYADVVKRLRDMGNKVITDRAMAFCNGDSSKYTEYIKTHEYRSTFSEKIKVQYLDKLDPVDIQEQFLSAESVLPSAYDFINEASHLGGWPSGQIIMVTSPPGGGKTLYMMREAAHMAREGHKVLYVALADMNISDFYIRLYAMETETPFIDATINFQDAYEHGAKLGENLAIIIAEADEISVTDVVDHVLMNMPDVKAVFLDYDSQFKIDKDDTGSMYEYAVRPYISASRFKSHGITTFIGAQPKTTYYGAEYLDLLSSGESSKKQQMVDYLLTIGTNSENSCPCGYIALPKARRFFNKFKVPYVRTNDGVQRVVDYMTYQEMRTRGIDNSLTGDKLAYITRELGAQAQATQSMFGGSMPEIPMAAAPTQSSPMPDLSAYANLSASAPTL